MGVWRYMNCCSETRPKFKIYYKIGRVYRAEVLRGSCAIVQLVQLDVSVLGLPSPLLPVGSVYSVALTTSLSTTSWCGSCSSWGRL